MATGHVTGRLYINRNVLVKCQAVVIRISTTSRTVELNPLVDAGGHSSTVWLVDVRVAPVHRTSTSRNMCTLLMRCPHSAVCSSLSPSRMVSLIRDFPGVLHHFSNAALNTRAKWTKGQNERGGRGLLRKESYYFG